MDKSKIYLDLSKLSEEQINKIESLIGAQIWRGNLLLHLHDKKKIWWAFEVWQSKTNKTELTYSQFLDMMGESEEVLQVENDIEKLAEESVNEVTENNGDYLFRDVYKAFFKEGFKKAMEIKSNQ